MKYVPNTDTLYKSGIVSLGIAGLGYNFLRSATEPIVTGISNGTISHLALGLNCLGIGLLLPRTFKKFYDKDRTNAQIFLGSLFTLTATSLLDRYYFSKSIVQAGWNLKNISLIAAQGAFTINACTAIYSAGSALYRNFSLSRTLFIDNWAKPGIVVGLSSFSTEIVSFTYSGIKKLAEKTPKIINFASSCLSYYPAASLITIGIVGSIASYNYFQDKKIGAGVSGGLFAASCLAMSQSIKGALPISPIFGTAAATIAPLVINLLNKETIRRKAGDFLAEGVAAGATVGICLKTCQLLFKPTMLKNLNVTETAFIAGMAIPAAIKIAGQIYKSGRNLITRH